MARRRIPGVRRRPGPGHLLVSRPWLRAPLAALGQPGASAAVLIATAILAIAASTAPLFLSAARTGALQRAVETCPDLYRPAVTNRSEDEIGIPLPLAATAYAPVEDAEVRRVLAARSVPAGERVLVLPTQGEAGNGPPLVLAAPGRLPRSVVGYASPLALGRVDVLRGRVGDRGAWLPERLARLLGVDVGDRLTARGRSVPVAGIYRGLDDPAYEGILPPRWCRWSTLVLPRIGDASRPVLPLVLLDDRTLLELAGTDRPWATWFAAVDPAAARASDAVAVARATAGAGAQVAIAPGIAGSYEDEGSLADAVARADQVRSALADATRPAALAATLVALLLVAAAGGYWAERRAGEVRLLAARGVGPPGLAGKAVLEMLGPAVLGALLGWGVTLAAAPRLGPSPLLDDGAAAGALRTVAVALVAGLLALGAVAGLRGRSTGERPIGLGRSWRALLPWELLLLAAAGWAYPRLRDSGAVTSGGEVIRVDPLLVMFPLLLIAGLVVLTVRLLGLPAGRLAGLAGRLPVPGFLAARRLAAARTVSAVVLVAVALPVGVLVACASLTATVEATVQAKATTYVGAQVTLRTDARPAGTPATGGLGTPVSQLPGGLSTEPAELPVLGVDPATFARYAYWRKSYAAEPLPDLLARLGPAGPDGAVPAILAGRTRSAVGAVTLRSSRLPVRVVGRAVAFPGMRSLATPLLVVDRRALAGVDRFAERTEEVWTDAPAAAAVARSIGAGGDRVTRRVEADTIVRATDVYPLTWTFGYVQALAGLAGVIGATALLLYLAARQRSRTAAYVLSRRMGLSRRAHVGSLLAELSLAVGLGAVLGVLLARLALGPVVEVLRLQPGRPPLAIGLVVPAAAVVAVAAGAVALVLLGTAVTQLAADRTRPADVLRGQQ